MPDNSCLTFWQFRWQFVVFLTINKEHTLLYIPAYKHATKSGRYIFSIYSLPIETLTTSGQVCILPLMVCKLSIVWSYPDEINVVVGVLSLTIWSLRKPGLMFCIYRVCPNITITQIIIAADNENWNTTSALRKLRAFTLGRLIPFRLFTGLNEDSINAG